MVSVFSLHGNCRDGDFRPTRDMHFYDLLIVHPVKLVTRKYQDKIGFRLIEKSKVLTNGISSALIPIHTINGLGCCKDFNKTPGKVIEFICPCYMSMKRCRIELCEYVNLIEVRVQAITDGNVYNPVFASKRDRRFRSFFCQGIEPCPTPSPKNYGNYSIHFYHSRYILLL